MWWKRGVPVVLVICLVCYVLVSSDLPDVHHHSNPHMDQRFGCSLSQKGFHLKLRCSLAPTSGGAWDQCHIDVDLGRDIYINPYEVTDRLPGIQFNITRRASQEAGLLSRLFGGGGKGSVDALGGNAVADNANMVTHVEQISIPASAIDVEAPAWAADTSHWKFILASSSPKASSKKDAILIDIPLHLRYNGPTPRGGVFGGVACESRSSCNGKDSISGPLEIQTPSGCASDLLLVMPLTVLFLVIGIIALLIQ